MSRTLGPNQRVRDYEIERRLGGGGQAVTWLAKDLRTGKRVVIKLLVLKTAESWKEIELFEREAQTLRGLDHPSIPRFVDAFEETDDAGSIDFFLVQTWVDAPSLAEALRSGTSFDLKRFCGLAFQLLDILAWLHDRLPPIVHRDLKPSNILLDSADRVHLIDFGAVKAQLAVGSEGESTIVGTHGYMPAEQLMGRASPQSDLYSLGATLVHLASGHHPTTLPSDGLRLDIRGVLSLPDAVVAWLETLLAPEPRDRPASAAIAKQRLASALADPHSQDKPTTPKKPAAMRNRAILALFGVLLSAGLWVLLALGLKDQAGRTPTAPSEAAAKAPVRETAAADPVFVAIPTELGADTRITVSARRTMLRRAEAGFPTASLHVAFDLESTSDVPITELKLLLTLERHGSDTRIRWDAVDETVPALFPGERRTVTAVFQDVTSRPAQLRVEIHRVSTDEPPPGRDEPQPLRIGLASGDTPAPLDNIFSFQRLQTFEPAKRAQRGRRFEDIAVVTAGLGKYKYMQMNAYCVAADGTRTGSLLADYGLQLSLEDTFPGEAPWRRPGDRFAYRAICPAETVDFIWQIDKLEGADPSP